MHDIVYKCQSETLARLQRAVQTAGVAERHDGRCVHDIAYLHCSHEARILPTSPALQQM